MMLRNIGRRYMPEAPPDVTKPDVKVTGATTKRRALGDITNAFTAEETKDNNNAVKKHVSNLAHAPEIKVEAADHVFTSRGPERDYMKRESDDIDARDAGNPLLATSCVNEMYNHFGILERKYSVCSTYMSNQPYVNERMRTILVDWLVCQILLCIYFQDGFISIKIPFSHMLLLYFRSRFT
jgi:hypothetical protein